MSFTIITKNSERTFNEKELVNISSREGFDFKVDFGFDCMLTVQYDSQSNRCVLLNQFNCNKLLFKGKPIPASLEIDKVCKLMVDGSDDFLMIKIVGETFTTSLSEENLTEADLKDLYGSEVNASARLKIEKRKAEIESARIAITKETASEINDLKHKLSMNSKGGIILHAALILMSLVCAFGVSNYLTGLPLKDAGSVIQMPTNLKLIFMYMFIIYGIGLTLKQGAYLYLQNKLGEDTTTSRIAEKFMITLPLIFYIAVYLINVLYYITPDSMQFFAVFISLFFVGTER